MREIILDTETTGLDPATGDRIVEIGCIEIFNSIPTGQIFHAYIDPQRDMPEGAFKVHGLSREFLTGKPVFEAIVDDFLAFTSDAKLVAHNAEFDIKFLNFELGRAARPLIEPHRVVDTLALARRRHPGASNSLDALCQRYRIDNSRRTKHGALLDAEILAEVYAELIGGRQSALILETERAVFIQQSVTIRIARETPLAPTITPEELAAHASFIAGLGGGALWNAYRYEEA
ncbi:MAG: dnaQ [Actinomycetia bacterium]|nr:dnaQ [Actinomycetes bacterium]